MLQFILPRLLKLFSDILEACVQELCGTARLKLNPPSISLVLHLAQRSLERYLGACNSVLWWSYRQGTGQGSCFINAGTLTAEICVGGQEAADQVTCTSRQECSLCHWFTCYSSLCLTVVSDCVSLLLSVHHTANTNASWNEILTMVLIS